MDIAAVATTVKDAQIRTQVGTEVAKTSGDVVKQQGEAAVAMMEQAVQLQKALTEAARARGGVDVVG